MPSDGECDPLNVNGDGQSGFAPQSLVPVGTFEAAPPSPTRYDWGEFRRLVLSVVAVLDTPAGDAMPRARLMRDEMQERDVRLASRNLPKRAPAPPRS